MPTIADLRADAIGRVPALDADLLIAHALGVERGSLYAHPEVPVAEADAERVRELIHRRAQGEPVAYLRGWREFYGLRFAVDRRVLVPRPETETIVDAVRALGPRLVADVGTGSGAIAVALAVHEPGLRVIATDVSADALEVARANAIAHGVADRVELRQGDLFDPLHERVDALAANLPYLADADEAAWTGDRRALRFEPRGALLAGPDGLAVIRRAIAGLGRVLAPDGVAFLECDPPQARLIAAEHGGEILRDLADDERVVALRAMMRM